MRRAYNGMLALLAVAVLVACADDTGPEDDRQFANDPVSTRSAEPTDVPATDFPPQFEPTSVPEESSSKLLRPRGAPENVFALVGGEILSVPASNPQRVITVVVPGSLPVLSIAQSVSGDRVAALVASNGSFSLIVLDREGREHERWDGFGTFTATPAAAEPAQGEVVPQVTWSANRDALLVTDGSTRLYSFQVGGAPESIQLPQRVQSVVRAEWSPRGDRIAFLDRDGEGRGVLWTIAPNVDGDSLVRVVPPNADAPNLGTVTEFAWMPNGSGLAFILADDVGSDFPGGMVYSIDLATGARRLMASPERLGPAAQIVDFAVSPDGKAVAYAIALPEGEDRGWFVDSLWVRSTRGSTVVQVSLVTAESMGRVQWAKDGLLVETWTEGSAHVDFIPAEGEAIAIVPTAVATPVAGTPSASPGATPVTTPISATPVDASPVASPLPATPVSASPVPPAP